MTSTGVTAVILRYFIQRRINLSRQSVHRFGGASTIFTVKTDDFLVVDISIAQLNDSFHVCLVVGPPVWWGILCT